MHIYIFHDLIQMISGHIFYDGKRFKCLPLELSEGRECGDDAHALTEGQVLGPRNTRQVVTQRRNTRHVQRVSPLLTSENRIYTHFIPFLDKNLKYFQYLSTVNNCT